MPTKLDKMEMNPPRWWVLVTVVAFGLWGFFIWVSWLAVSPYISETFVAAALSLIMGFVGVCAACLICMVLVMLAAVFIVPKRRQSAAR